MLLEKALNRRLAVRFLVAEFGGGNRKLHGLFLKQRNAERALQYVFEFIRRPVFRRRRRITDPFRVFPPLQIRMHHIALNRSRANDRDFDHKIVEAARF